MHGAVGEERSRLAAGSEGAYKLAFAVLVIVAALGFTYTRSDGNFPPFELRDVLLRVLVFCGVLLVAALALPRRSVSNAALALVTLAGVFTAYVVHTQLFDPSHRVWMIIVLAASFFALFTAFQVIEQRRWAGNVLMGAAALAGAAAAWPEIEPELRSGLSTPGGLLGVRNPAMWAVVALAGISSVLAPYLLSKVVRPVHWGGLALLAVASVLAMLIFVLGSKFGEDGSGYYSGGWEDHPNVRSVTFEETPNIYFVGFDSIAPEAIMRKYMGLETTDFHGVLGREMRRLRNLFANGDRTTFSFNALMALDQRIYLENRNAGGLPSYFAGHDLSPLIWLLRLNGYETTSIYQDTFFGREQGPHIDNYVVNRRKALCSLLDEDARALAFWGYCWTLGTQRLPATERVRAGDFLVQQLSAIDRESPQFVIAHFGLPGHTPKIFDYNNKSDMERFLPEFVRGFNTAAIYLEQIIEHLRANDPDAILFVFGDHGAWLSRGVDVEDNPAFFLQDRFGILGGVYPRDRCAAELDAAEGKGYATSLDVVHAIIECLSDGQSPLVEPRRDRFWTPDLPENHSYDYKEFLYE
ncbi:MAG: hypothetical protein F4X98_01475 [Gammaproteobacteria bacterium]|nr:hypothetical protein [Gammaproteobacteria bacterium]